MIFLLAGGSNEFPQIIIVYRQVWEGCFAHQLLFGLVSICFFPQIIFSWSWGRGSLLPTMCILRCLGGEITYLKLAIFIFINWTACCQTGPTGILSLPPHSVISLGVCRTPTALVNFILTLSHFFFYLEQLFFSLWIPAHHHENIPFVPACWICKQLSCIIWLLFCQRICDWWKYLVMP